MDPIDEVRTVMTAFDETLFLVVLAVYRELTGRWPTRRRSDRAPKTTAPRPKRPGGRGAACARLPAARQLGGRGPGRQPVRDRAGLPATATIQADHILRALENAKTRIGRALTLHEATTPLGRGLRRALAAVRPPFEGGPRSWPARR